MLNDRDMALQMNDFDSRLDELDQQYREEHDKGRALQQNILDLKRHSKQLLYDTVVEEKKVRGF